MVIISLVGGNNLAISRPPWETPPPFKQCNVTLATSVHQWDGRLKKDEGASNADGFYHRIGAGDCGDCCGGKCGVAWGERGGGWV